MSGRTHGTLLADAGKLFMPHCLPMLGLLAFTAVASFYEVCRREIPNRLTWWGLLAGLCLNTMSSARPWSTLAMAVVAVGLGAAVAIPLWRLGVLGGGDVKLVAACGAFVTPLLMLGLVGHALLLLGLFAMILFALDQRLGEALVASTRFILGYPPEAVVRSGSALHVAPAVFAGSVITWLG